MEPAQTIIAICGGLDAVAKITGRNAANVRRWTYGKHQRGGTGGVIPFKAQKILLAAARERGLPLTAEHFFAPVQEAS